MANGWAKKKTSKGTLVESHKGGRRFIRRNKKGEFSKEITVGRSLAGARKRSAKSKAKKGRGNRGHVKK